MPKVVMIFSDNDGEEGCQVTIKFDPPIENIPYGELSDAQMRALTLLHSMEQDPDSEIVDDQ